MCSGIRDEAAQDLPELKSRDGVHCQEGREEHHGRRVGTCDDGARVLAPIEQQDLAFVDTDNSKSISAKELQSFLEDFDYNEFVQTIQTFRTRALEEFGDIDSAFKAMLEKNAEELSIKDWDKACKNLLDMGNKKGGGGGKGKKKEEGQMDPRYIFTFLDVSANFSVGVSEFRLLNAFDPAQLDGSPRRLKEFIKAEFSDAGNKTSYDQAFDRLVELKKGRAFTDGLLALCKCRLKASDLELMARDQADEEEDAEESE